MAIPQARSRRSRAIAPVRARQHYGRIKVAKPIQNALSHHEHYGITLAYAEHYTSY